MILLQVFLHSSRWQIGYLWKAQGGQLLMCIRLFKSCGYGCTFCMESTRTRAP